MSCASRVLADVQGGHLSKRERVNQYRHFTGYFNSSRMVDSVRLYIDGLCRDVDPQQSRGEIEMERTCV